MDPYLEHPSAWTNVHHRLITAIADDLAPKLLPKYQSLVEERIYQVEGQDAILVGAPDVTNQWYECPVVNLRALLDGVYDRSGYGFVIDYAQEPVPPLAEAEAQWAQAWIRNKT
jgi:hypothetical protein